MILYQVAKRVEERTRLKQTIRDTVGDVSCLIGEKLELEQSILSQATKWKESIPVFKWSGTE